MAFLFFSGDFNQSLLFILFVNNVMKILFSENEMYYRELGLKDISGVSYVFNGLMYYNHSLTVLSRFNLFVCSFYTLPHNTLLTIKFRSLSIKTMLCSDGIFEFSNAIDNKMITKYGVMLFHPIIQDYFLCVGEKETKYFNQMTTRVLKFMPKRMLSKSELIELPKYKKTLITTANTAYFSKLEFNRLKKIILEISELLRANSIEFSFRIFDEKLLLAIRESLDFDIVNDVKNSFEKTIESYTSVITTPSSIAITSMYHQRSVSLLIYRDKPMLLQAGWLTPSAGVLKDSLDSFVNLDPERINIQNGLLKSYLTDDGITEHIQTILALETHVKIIKMEEFIDNSLVNMLNSRFNFNMEWFARKVYQKFKGAKVMKRIRQWIK